MGVRFGKLPPHLQRAAIALLWATVVIATITMHRGLTRKFYRVERSRLETIASTAAYSGALLLPFNPNGARQAAHAYAELNGVPAEDVVLVLVADDRRSLTVKLIYKVPLLFGLFDRGAGKVLTVNARADLGPTLPGELEAL